jgi:hypothetical protein
VKFEQGSERKQNASSAVYQGSASEQKDLKALWQEMKK